MSTNNTFLRPNKNSRVVFQFLQNCLLYAKYLVMSEQLYSSEIRDSGHRQ